MINNLIYLFYNFKIFNLNLGALLLGSEDYDNYTSNKYLMLSENTDRFNGFFFNLKSITLIEIDNFLLFYNCSFFILNDLTFKKKLIIFLSIFCNEGYIYLFMSLLDIEELYHLLSLKEFSIIYLFKLVSNFNKRVNLELIRLFIFCLKIFEYNNINYIKFKSLIFNGFKYFNNLDKFYLYYINMLNFFSNISYTVFELYLYYNLFFIENYSKYIYKIINFIDLNIYFLKKLVYNLYNYYDLVVNKSYTIFVFFKYFKFLNVLNNNELSTLFINELFFFHEINNIYRIYFFKILKLYLCKKKIKFNLLLKYLFWKLHKQFLIFLNFLKIFKIQENFYLFLKAYIYILFNYFRKCVYNLFLFRIYYKFFDFINYFYIKFLNKLLFTKFNRNFFLNNNFILYYKDFFFFNILKLSKIIINNNFLINLFSANSFLNYFNKKNLFNFTYHFFKNLNISVNFKVLIFLFFSNFKLNYFNFKFLLFNLTYRSLDFYFYIKKFFKFKNFFFYFFNYIYYYPYYLNIINLYNLSEKYLNLYVPISYRIISSIEEFFEFVSGDYPVEGYEGFFVNYDYEFFLYYKNYDMDLEENEGFYGIEYYSQDEEEEFLYEEQFYIFDIYNEIKSFNEYVYFLYNKKYDNFTYFTTQQNNLKNNSFEINNIYYNYFNDKNSPYFDKLIIMYDKYMMSDVFLWDFWSFLTLESDLDCFVDVKSEDYLMKFDNNFIFRSGINFIEKNIKFKYFLNNSFIEENFLNFKFIQKFFLQRNFENQLYLGLGGLLNSLFLYFDIYYLKSMGFLYEKWWWWFIIKGNLNGFVSKRYLLKYLRPQNKEEFFFLSLFSMIGIFSKLLDYYPKSEFKKVEVFFDNFIKKFLKDFLVEKYVYYNKFYDLIYLKWLQNYNDIIFYFDYIELVNLIYEFSLYLDISYYKIYKFLIKIENLFFFFIKQTNLNLFINYYHPYLKKQRYLFFEFFFLSLFSILYKLFQFELEFENEPVIDFLDNEAPEEEEPLFFLEFMDDMYIPGDTYIDSYESIYDYINMANTDEIEELYQNLDSLKVNKLINYTSYFLNYINDPYFLFDKGFNVSFSFPELIFMDLYENYGLYFFDLDEEEILEINYLHSYKFFEENSIDLELSYDKNPMDFFLIDFEYNINSEGIKYDLNYLGHFYSSFYNYYIGENYTLYLTRLNSLYNYNLLISDGINKYLNSNKNYFFFFFNQFLSISKRLSKKKDFFFFKYEFLYNKLFFIFCNILKINNFFFFKFDKNNKINLYLLLIKLLFFSFLFFLNNVSDLFLKINLLILFPIYFFFLIYKFLKIKFLINIFNISINQIVSELLSIDQIYKLFFFILKDIYLFFYYFFNKDKSYNNLYFFFFRYNFLFKNLFNVKVFKLFFKLFKINSKNDKNIFNIDTISNLLYSYNFSKNVSFRSYYSLNLFYKNFDQYLIKDYNIFNSFDFLINRNLNNKDLFELKFENLLLQRNELSFFKNLEFKNLINFNNIFFDKNLVLFNIEENINKTINSLNFPILLDNYFFDEVSNLKESDYYMDNLVESSDELMFFNEDFDGSLDNINLVDEWSERFTLGDTSDDFEIDEENLESGTIDSVIGEEYNYEFSNHNFFKYIDIYFNNYIYSSLLDNDINDDSYLNNYLKTYNLIRKKNYISLFFKIFVRKLFFYFFSFYKKIPYSNYFNLTFTKNYELSLYFDKYTNFIINNHYKENQEFFGEKLNFFNSKFIEEFFNNISNHSNNVFNFKLLLNDFKIEDLNLPYYDINVFYSNKVIDYLDIVLDGIDETEEDINLLKDSNNSYNSLFYLKISYFNIIDKKKKDFFFLFLFYYYYKLFFDKSFDFFLLKLEFFFFIELFLLKILFFFNFEIISFNFFKYLYNKIYKYLYIKLINFFYFYKYYGKNNLNKANIVENFFLDLDIITSFYFFFFDNNLNLIIFLRNVFKFELSLNNYIIFNKYLIWLFMSFFFLKLTFKKIFFFKKIYKFYLFLKQYEQFLVFNNYNIFQIYIRYNLNEVYFYIYNWIIYTKFIEQTTKKQFYLSYLFIYDIIILIFFFFLVLIYIYILFFDIFSLINFNFKFTRFFYRQFSSKEEDFSEITTVEYEFPTENENLQYFSSDFDSQILTSYLSNNFFDFF